MRVHVTLDRATFGDPQAREAVLGTLLGCGLTNVNRRRYDRYGILSGDIDPLRVTALESVEGVLSVQADEERSALQGAGPDGV